MAGFKGERPGQSPQGLHKTEIEPTDCGANIISYPMSTERSSLGVKRQWREADNSTVSSVEVKKVGALPPLPHLCSWRSA
jgi:hypothetical protein